VKSFNAWDRATLIDNYGAKFYHGQPTKATMSFVREGQEWHVVSEQRTFAQKAARPGLESSRDFTRAVNAAG